MSLLSSRSLSPQNAFGARLTLHNYPPGGHTSGASEMPPADRRTKLRRVAETLSKVGVTRFFAGEFLNTKVGDKVRRCFNGAGKFRARLGVSIWTVEHVFSSSCLDVVMHNRFTGLVAYRRRIRSWVRVK